MLKDKIQSDLKTAMLARDSQTVDVLKGLKSAILYVEVAEKKRDIGLSDDEILVVFKKEAKKRQDSVDLYIKAGQQDRADSELAEKAIIETYLPAQLSEQEVQNLISESISELGLSELTQSDMGKIMGSVKSRTGPELDGSMLARLVKERIDS